MACSNCYLPVPPRVWSRVQNSCSLITDTDTNNNELVRVPYSNKFVSAAILGDKLAMLNKGNVLQYKANSSNLTQSQKYSKIAQGKWTNRNTTWATQSSRGYTNPNNSSLKRSGNVVNISIDPITGAIIGQTDAPVTCPKPITIINEALPSNAGGGSANEPDIPPPVEPTPESDTFPETIPDTPIEPIVIQDEGTLICSIQENICTGETKSTLAQQLCNPTSDSDVPGTIQDLCWNDGTPTWYPRQRYIMSNSGNKWPVNYKFLDSAIKPSPPIITFITNTNINIINNLNIVTLKWIQDETCLPVATFDIYQNGILVKSVNGNVFTTELQIVGCGLYEYFIIAVTNGSNISSDKSNIVSININSSSPPESVVVNWAAVNVDIDVIPIKPINMDINMIFTPPLLIRCGVPDFFVVNVINSTSTIIATQNIPYDSVKTSYIVNFDNIEYAATGTINVYLVTIDTNTGNTYNGDIASCDFVSSFLPIYIDTQINQDKTELSFKVITESELNPLAGVIFPNLDENTFIFKNWPATESDPPGLYVSIKILTNSEFEYSITMKSEYFDLLLFPNPFGIVVSNKVGIQKDIVTY